MSTAKWQGPIPQSVRDAYGTPEEREAELADQRTRRAERRLGQARLDAAVRYWRLHQGGRFQTAEADGDDVVIRYNNDLANGHRYRVHAADIDAQLASEQAQRDLVERLQAHGLAAVQAGPGAVNIHLTDARALRLVEALDRLEAQP